MNLLYPVFTVVMFLTSFLCGLHAWGDRDRLVFYGSAIVYGLLLEKLVILYFQNYTYPAAKMLDFAGIPIAIGFGWSAVIYGGYTTARAFGLGRRYLPVFAGLYAVHLDLAMDAIAIRVPFWEWTPPGAWFGVPLGNFLGWYLVALFFTFTYQWVSARTDVPLAIGMGTIAGAVALLIPTLEVWTRVTDGVVLRKAIILSGVLLVSMVYVWTAEFQPAPVPRLVTASIFLFHGFPFAVLLVLGIYASQPLVAVVSLAMVTIGVYLHAGVKTTVTEQVPVKSAD
ncbi:carotenoid biosynthesis protein [Halorussus salinisoli]|uniref:carotenoid biosynthesis protein n=1 Tax=Halorussus salinisoli TaxID=2558242 RepID=UPI0010C1BD4E|nr:carotenoid biosynthesis protein [Halorussus salinisoli]